MTPFSTDQHGDGAPKVKKMVAVFATGDRPDGKVDMFGFEGCPLFPKFLHWGGVSVVVVHLSK